jgi:hypothetical protein
MPIAFCSTNLGDEVVIKCGCVDLTSEGGTGASKQYRSVVSGEVSLTTAEKAVLALRVNNDVYDQPNTRDNILKRLLPYTDGNALLRLYYFRNPAAITATWSAVNGGFISSAIGAAVVDASTNYGLMNKVVEVRVGAGQTVILDNPGDDMDFNFVAGDYLLLTMQAKANTLGGVTVEMAEEV